MTLTSDHTSSPDGALDQIRHRNWVAITVATVLMMFCTLTYGAAFVSGSGDPEGVEPRLVGVALAIAPFVFIALAFLSQNAHAPRDVLRAMGLLLVIALGVGLIDPVLGAAVGFGAGGAVTLRRPITERVIRWRIYAVLFMFVYCLVLLVVIPPAGVFSAAMSPLLLIGMSDEFADWSSSNS